MATNYSASVADVLALDALLDKMNDLDRASIERAIAFRVRRGAESSIFIDEAKREYRAVQQTRNDVATKLTALREAMPEKLKEKVDEITSLLGSIPAHLDALDFAA